MLYACPMERDALRDFIERHSRLFILTGAGCSTDSGIPDYRDAEGGWKRASTPSGTTVKAEGARRRRSANSVLAKEETVRMARARRSLGRTTVR